MKKNSRKQGRKTRLNKNKKKVWVVAGLLLLVLVGMLTIFVVLSKIEETKKVEMAQAKITQEKEQKAKEETERKKQMEAGTVVETDLSRPWQLILANPINKLPTSFTVELKSIQGAYAVDSRIYSDLKKMLDDCKSQGLNPQIISAYRSQEKQQTLYNREVREHISSGYDQAKAEKEAAKWVAVPGTSEHQTGLAIDIVAASHIVLDRSQASTPEQKWLMANCYKYGFVLRFPDGKTEITGINYEPWHYRYVGKTVAKEIHQGGMCLEEYLYK